jgi:phage terminase large subunit
MTTRTTGRGAVMPYTQIFGDCNPGGSMHHLKQRAKVGHLTMYHTTLRDNPSLYSRDGTPTAQGVRTEATLNKLTGIRRKRLKDGIWATAEGAVYDNFDSSIHVKVRDPREMKSWYLAIDEGYTNPAVILLVGEDSDGRTHTFREFYRSGVLQERVVARAKRFMDWVYARNVGDLKRSGMNVTEARKLARRVELVAVDEAAAGLIADLVNHSIPAQPAKGRVLDGISKMQNRLSVAGDGLPRETVDPSCVNTINEYESYIWKKTAAGISKDEPQKENDHTKDARRYLEVLISTDRWTSF